MTSLKNIILHQFNDFFASGPILFAEDFESLNLNQWCTEDLCCDYSFEYVDSPVFLGKRAGKFTLSADDPKVSNGQRCELKRYGLFTLGTERWYRFSLFLPECYSDDHSGEIVTQWHGIPDFLEGETWRKPPLALITRNGKWLVQQRWDSGRVIKEPRFTKITDLGPYQTSTWTSWIFHIKWSFGSDGVLEIWKDQDQIYQATGPNTYNDLFGPYFKIGIYKNLGWDDRDAKTSRTLYLDDVRIGNAAATFEDMN